MKVSSLIRLLNEKDFYVSQIETKNLKLNKYFYAKMDIIIYIYMYIYIDLFTNHMIKTHR